MRPALFGFTRFHHMGRSIRDRKWIAYAAATWALVFGAFHLIWAFGWYVGLDRDQSRIAFGRPLFYAYDVLVAVMCVLGAVVALAPVSPWGVRFPFRPTRVVAWTGTVLLAVRAVASLIQLAYLLATGRFTLRTLGIWEPWFYLGAILFGTSTAYHWRKPRVTTDRGDSSN